VSSFSGEHYSVDLDGTLVRTDTLIESLLAILRYHPGHLFVIPTWLFRGLPYTKHRIQALHQITVELLPYNQDVLDVIRRERSAGRQTILVTAANQELADKIAGYLGLFDEAHGTQGRLNLKGKVKADFLTERFGQGGYDYIGDSRADVPVWQNARTAITVNASAARTIGRKIELLPDSVLQKSPVVRCAQTMRVHQWIKNVLVFVPLLTSQRILDTRLLLRCFAAAVALCCLASATYIFNDFLDIESDREHHTKRSRSIASGKLSFLDALILAFSLAALGIVIAAQVSKGTVSLCLLYVICTLSYSLVLKRKLLVDTLMLAGLYTLRVLIGGVATGIAISFWLLTFSIFVFFSLAVVKRVAEISVTPSGSMVSGRGYQKGDSYVLTDLGTSSAFVATAVFALYINSKEVQLVYANPKVLWILCPLILYWFGRVWILTTRGKMHDDPIIFVFKDRISYLLAIIGLASLVIAKFGRFPQIIERYIAF
jgi:4-hydroxybenzoate polyprenyltransferase/phosphoserine phosphatase